jgi:outer membrane protein OmpA-like peptidoglycan-associated protein
MVMRLWRSLPAQDQGPEAVDSGHALVADQAAPAEAIQALIEAIQADQRILKAAHIDMARLDPSISMSDPPIALHAGAEAYLSSNGILLAAAPSDEQENLVEPEAEAILEEQPLIVDATELGGRSFTIFFETDEAKLDREDYVSVAEACRYAATLPTARFIISGHADTVGPETYNTQLSRRRAESAAGAIENDPRFREALSVMEYGESMLAVTTEDGVDEPKNRRVEITVVQNE